MKVLILGKNGQVGSALCREMANTGEIVAFDRSQAPLDDARKLTALIERNRPDIVVNAAAYTAVDRAEGEPDLAGAINRDGPSAIAAAVRQLGGWLIHYSTDYVYDGLKQGAYGEDDLTNPLSVYGLTKLQGDEAIQKSGCNHLIFRVSWVYAEGHQNFPQSMFNLALERPGLRIVSDQVGAPTSATLIARITAEAVGRIVRGDFQPAMSGVYNLAPSGVVNRAELVAFLVRQMQQAGLSPALAADNIEAIQSSQYPLPAQRPLNSELDTGKLRAVFGLELPEWQQDMQQWVQATARGYRQ